MERYKRVFEVDIGVHFCAVLKDGKPGAVRCSVIPYRESRNILYFSEDFKSAGQSAIGRIIEVTVCPSVRHILRGKEADGKGALIKVIELVVAGGIGTEEALASRADLIDSCGDLFTG